uniref:Spire-type actin nucleation factor 1a n=1 Tax=Takifugu rubripes TaxID=31033 RepID=A0A674P6C4_TAKRU
MAKRPGTDDEMLNSSAVVRDLAPESNSRDINMEPDDGAAPVSLEEILNLYNQPINEEQAWAVCYQCCRTLAQIQRRKSLKSAGASAIDYPRRIEGAGDVMIWRDGTVKLHFSGSADTHTSPPTSLEVIDSLGVMIYKALDYGLKENEERELSPPLERLIDLMTNTGDTESDPCPDEGYEATEEEDECEEEEEPVLATTGSSICSSHLPSPSDAPNHYQAVCRALFAEARELCTFLEKIKTAKENLRRMEGDMKEPVKDLDELQNADWARFWVQVMRNLRDGVKLKKVQERQYNPLPIEYQLTPYEMLMDDIRSKRYKLRKVMVNGDIPPRLKKSAHEIILEFIRSRPPLNPVSARKLKPHPPRPQSLHERLLEGIKAERKLRPVSPDLIRRSRLGTSFISSADTPDASRKLAVSTQSLASGTTGPSPGGALPLSQRKRLLKAPTLAELDSSESDVRCGTCRTVDVSFEDGTRSSRDDTSPESMIGKRTPPNFLPMSGPPQSDRRQSSQRRHSIEKEAPTVVLPFSRPSRQTSKSLEEFCYPVECLALTVEEVMHIRQVLVKAELEKFQQYKDIYTALKKGKLCFSCRNKKFSLFTWSYTCQFSKEGASGAPAPAEQDKHPFGSSQSRHSLRRSVSKLSKHGSKDAGSQDELELPKEMTEDWVAMEICVDCKKFITEIISSSKRSLCVASKRARLNRKTQSFYMSSSHSVNFMPSERTINEV